MKNNRPTEVETSRVIPSRRQIVPWLTKTLWVVLPCAAGLLVIVVGFLCDPLWPSQDMTPEMWRDHRLAQERANRMYLAGAAMFAVGAIRFLMRCWSLLARR